MANNYTQFSVSLFYDTDEQYEWLRRELEKMNDGDEGPVCEYRDEPGKPPFFWLYTEESAGDIGKLADVVAAYQQQFRVMEPWFLTWAHTCGKPRIGEFSGGGVAVYRGKQKYFIPVYDMERWVRRKKNAEVKKEGTR